jgi:hypothetical protein
MTIKEKRELVGELRGFFPGDNENEMAGNAIEKALLIGMSYGFAHDCKDYGPIARHAAVRTMNNVGISPQYHQSIIHMLEGR